MTRGINKLPIDLVQAKILKELLADGRKKEDEIAKQIGATKQDVRKHYNKMVKTGIIRGATTHINYRLFGFKAVAFMIIKINPTQTQQLVEKLQQMTEIYVSYSRGIPGTVDAITILKSVEQLNEIKDKLTSNFTILETKTAIWTDVKEMNYNLAIIDENRKIPMKFFDNMQPPVPKESNHIDEIDLKIADRLAENGRISMMELGKSLCISSNAAKRRYIKLKEKGALKVTIQVDLNKIGYQAMCIFFTTIAYEKLQTIIKKISTIPDVISIMKTTGDYDLQIYAMLQNLDQMLSIKEEISKIEGIRSMDFEINRIRKEMDKWPSPRQYISTF